MLTHAEQNFHATLQELDDALANQTLRHQSYLLMQK
jgi:hypothetical protein